MLGEISCKLGERIVTLWDLCFTILGSIWGRLQTTFDWWEVELVFRVTGRGRIGADGLVSYWKGQDFVLHPENVLVWKCII